MLGEKSKTVSLSIINNRQVVCEYDSGGDLLKNLRNPRYANSKKRQIWKM